jgi:ribosomal protein S18 acetylase RimI-like enzyme
LTITELDCFQALGTKGYTLVRLSGMKAVAIRKASEADFDFLFELHRQALGPYVEQTWGWDEVWQRDYFKEHFMSRPCEVIELQGERIGCMRVEDQEEFVLLDYIAIMPAHQRIGLGTHLVRTVLKRAVDRGVPARLKVLRVNPAKTLYERLGFETIGADQYRFYMEAKRTETG